MSWTQSGKLYLPPQKPVAKVYNTDDYVEGTGYFFHAGTERLLVVGHPYFDIMDSNDEHKVAIPKVSANQYRVLRLRFPDPNKFAIADACVYNPEKERLVWRLVGFQLDRGGPLGIGATGHPYFNKYVDAENPSTYPAKQADNGDYRQDMAFDPKQVQICIVGCTPPTGQYWDTTTFCPDHNTNNGDCPPIELRHTTIQDGDMCEIGFGNANFEHFNQDRASVPLELTNEISLWPDFVKMSKDLYGDQMFFCAKRETLYARHYLTKAGINGDTLPTGSYWNPDQPTQKEIGSYAYYTTPSGSLVSSDTSIFNRAYWLHKALGANNGVLWGNDCFITVVDNSRNINFSLTIYKDYKDKTSLPDDNSYTYKAKDFKNYLRHPEEYEVEVIVELCKVSLTADIIAHLNVMNPRILDDWELAYVPPAPEGIQDAYRYLQSDAIKCQQTTEQNEKKDPYENYVFWNINLTEKLTAELSQTALGKRFLYQTGQFENRKLQNCGQTIACKRCVPSSCSRNAKKRRKN
ncbi:L1 [Gammapapillomavirus 22]|uniref:Major capsid protein L1 n=1 Tax=Gammapapillomavirus 22 TaxID=1961679 RepID=A0A2D2ALZ3_9PAPI|nr:L1 [Gammapapillomavirus 22]